jgi:oligopeptidase B
LKTLSEIAVAIFTKRVKRMKTIRFFISILLLVPLNILAQNNEKIVPPKADIKLHADTAHGEVRIDPYSWLRNKENPEVIDYLKKENEYAEAIMSPTTALQEKLFQEMKGRIKETDSQLPYKKGSYLYYERKEEGKDYSIICRKKGTMKAPEEIILDINILAQGQDYFNIGQYIISPDQNFLAYLFDDNGSERYSLRIKDLQKKVLLKDEIRNVGSFAWATDKQTIFYTSIDSSSRADKLFRHQIGMTTYNDPLVFNELDDSYYLNPILSKDEKYIFILSSSLESTEYSYIKADSPKENLRTLFPRKEGVEYYVEHGNGRFYIQSNEWEQNFELFTVNDINPNKADKQIIVPHQTDAKIESFDLFKNYLICNIKKRGLNKLLVINNTSNEQYFIGFDEDDYVIGGSNNEIFDSDYFRYLYSSLTTPRTIYDYNFKTKEKVIKKQQEIPSGYNPKDYQSERVWVPIKDGIEIPVSLVYKKGLKKDGQNPMFLTGYGAYGYNYEVYFNQNVISLLDRGFVFGIAHIRGGGELGKEWFNQGKLLNKINSFSDFIACSEFLIKNGYVSPDKLAIEGASAGGLLMGAVINMRPDLFHTVIALVPWADVLNDMFDPFLPGTPLEWKHIGDPKEKIYYDYIKSYSPYDNVFSHNYPNIYVTAGINDPRVFFWEPAKWVAKMRALKTDDNIILLNTNFDSGHFGKTGRFDAIQKRATEFAFILKTMNINK